MSGTLSGGKKAAATNKERYGESYYKRIGGLSLPSWIANGRKPRGFAANKELARLAGARAGKISKRGHRFVRSDKEYNYYVATDTGEVVKYKHDSESKG